MTTLQEVRDNVNKATFDDTQKGTTNKTKELTSAISVSIITSLFGKDTPLFDKYKQLINSMNDAFTKKENKNENGFNNQKKIILDALDADIATAAAGAPPVVTVPKKTASDIFGPPKKIAKASSMPQPHITPVVSLPSKPALKSVPVIPDEIAAAKAAPAPAAAKVITSTSSTTVVAPSTVAPSTSISSKKLQELQHKRNVDLFKLHFAINQALYQSNFDEYFGRPNVFSYYR